MKRPVTHTRIEPRQYTVTNTLECGHVVEHIQSAAVYKRGSKKWILEDCIQCSNLLSEATVITGTDLPLTKPHPRASALRSEKRKV